MQEFPLLPLLDAPKHQPAPPACRKMGEELSGPCVLGAQITGTSRLCGQGQVPKWNKLKTTDFSSVSEISQ